MLNFQQVLSFLFTSDVSIFCYIMHIFFNVKNRTKIYTFTEFEIKETKAIIQNLISEKMLIINPFFPNDTFLYPLEVSENHKVFWFFSGGYRNKTLVGNVLKLQQTSPNTAGIYNWRRSGVFTVNFEHISHLVLVFLLLTLSR